MNKEKRQTDLVLLIKRLPVSELSLKNTECLWNFMVQCSLEKNDEVFKKKETNVIQRDEFCTYYRSIFSYDK